MVLPLVKLGSLAFRTLSKPIAARLKHSAGIHPKFRGFIIGIAQVIDGSFQSDSSCFLIFTVRTAIFTSMLGPVFAFLRFLFLYVKSCKLGLLFFILFFRSVRIGVMQ
jgi:hypothetical protein